jgi:hypothetical protein
MADWFKSAWQRLRDNGFVFLEHTDAKDFAGVARRSRFELTKFGYCETFYIFKEFEYLDADAMRQFSAEAFRYAKAHRKCFLPCGLFEAVFSFAVATADRVRLEAERMIRNDVPPKHWAAAEMRVAYDEGRDELFYLEKTPLWGAAYYSGFRKQIRRFLEGAE